MLAYTLAPICLLLFGAAVALEVVYCALRAVTPWKTVVSGVMVGLGGVAGWAAVAPLSWRVLSVFGFLALWEIGGRNIANDLADVDADRSVGVKTVATVYGPAVAARAACIVGYATLASTVTLPMTAGLLSDLALGAGVLIVAWPGAKLGTARRARKPPRTSTWPASTRRWSWSLPCYRPCSGPSSGVAHPCSARPARSVRSARPARRGALRGSRRHL